MPDAKLVNGQVPSIVLGCLQSLPAPMLFVLLLIYLGVLPTSTSIDQSRRAEAEIHSQGLAKLAEALHVVAKENHEANVLTREKLAEISAQTRLLKTIVDKGVSQESRQSNR